MKAVVGMSAAIARTAVKGVAVGREGSWERMLRGLEREVCCEHVCRGT